jgi:two-component system phosphate regulon sensor histidine kinase PhoR
MSPSVSSQRRQARIGRLGGAGRRQRPRGRQQTSAPKGRGARLGLDPENLEHGSRLIAAYEAALAVAQEVTPQAVLQRIVDAAREVIPARYAALGLVDEQTRITQVFTSGVTPEERARIGWLPEGHGLLGAMIHECAPLLIPDIAADPASVGFPPGHPLMRTLVGVPIVLGGRVLGNLYLAERWDEQPFDEDDLAALQILATHAAAAIDRAQVYQRVEQQRDQLRIILDTLPAGLMIVAAPDAQTVLANAAACAMAFGSAPPPSVLPIYGRDFQLRQADGTPLSLEQRMDARAQLLQGDVIRNHQYLLESADGRRVPVLAQIAPLPNTAGVVDRAVLVLQDITRLREAEQLKDDFLSLVSHEFRTPLTTIHGGAHLLASQSGTLDGKTRRELLVDIVAQSDHLDQMLANMLTLTAVMAGRLPVRTEPLLLEPLAYAAAAQVAAHAPDHQFLVEMPADLPLSEGDPALLRQVLRNLYENAVKYSPGGGAVRTTASLAGGMVTIHVADSGIGIAAEDMDRVFGRFHRVGADPSVRGMGLGLYLCHHLVEAQGGHISASSPGPGQGTTFSVTLPVARDWEDEQEAKRSGVPGGG